MLQIFPLIYSQDESDWPVKKWNKLYIYLAVICKSPEKAHFVLWCLLIFLFSRKTPFCVRILIAAIVSDLSDPQETSELSVDV